MDVRTREFRELQYRLRFSSADVAQLIGRARQTVHQYRSTGPHGRTPPESVLMIMRAARDERLEQNLADAIAEIRSRGLDIDWAKLDERREDHDAHKAPFRRPPFLPVAA